jgi:hypothetical protein
VTAPAFGEVIVVTTGSSLVSAAARRSVVAVPPPVTSSIYFAADLIGGDTRGDIRYAAPDGLLNGGSRRRSQARAFVLGFRKCRRQLCGGLCRRRIQLRSVGALYREASIL